MDIQKYIKSGVLEQYCLGNLNGEEQAYLIKMATLYPEIKAELTAVELAFEGIAATTAREPGSRVKQNILALLGFNEILNVDDLPVICLPGNPQPWLDAFEHLIPGEPAEPFTLHVLKQDATVQQMLVTGRNDIPEEEHGEFYEGLFVLKGRCECTIGENFYALGPGDFVEIPLHTKHDIKLVTPIVTAVLQYRFVQKELKAEG